MVIKVTRSGEGPTGREIVGIILVGWAFHLRHGKEDMAHADTGGFIVVLLTLENPYMTQAQS